MAGSMNDRVLPVVDYAPDPHGGWLFSSLARAINNGVNGSVNVVIDRTPTYAGVVDRPIQRFTGRAGMGAAMIYADRAPQMNQQQTSTDSATAAIFASRMARGR